MIRQVAIRDIVLIDRAELAFDAGLCALTGETGAGKSILLDALSLALGRRNDRAAVRQGAAQGSVSVTFTPPARHPAFALLADSGIDAEDEIIVRRQVVPEGRARAFVNDQAVSAQFLRALGDTLVEIHGQHDERGLLSAAQHRGLLDGFGRLEGEAQAVGTAHGAWRQAEDALAGFDAALAQARADADYTAHAAKELARLNAQVNEEETLAAERALLTASEKIAGELAAAVDLIAGGDKAIDVRLAGAQRRLERLQTVAQGLLDPAIEAIARAATEAMEARAQAEAVLERLAFDPVRLEKIDDRLQALRDIARKYRVTPDALPELAARFASQVRGLEDSEAERRKLADAVKRCKAVFDDAAASLSLARRAAATRLGESVAKELKPLKLERAQFSVMVENAPPSPAGIDRAEFLLATTPGAALQPLTKIASGGELARIVLALKVALLQRGSAPTLIFDEVDQGIGGAVADAVGLRLKRLAQSAQVIVVTHSPQVAARANHHFRITKRARGSGAETRVEALDADGRREEIARMLSGATVTQEARAAADRLMEAGRR